MTSWHAAQAAIADPRSPAALRTIPTASADSPAAPDEVRFLTTRSLSVILPAYNEEEVIQHTADVVTNVLRPWVPEFEVIVVNDGSTDATGPILQRLAASDRAIRVINHPINRGYGAALVTGFESASKDLVFFMDSDGQFDIRELAGFLPLAEEYDAVLGYRLARQDTRMRRLNAWGWKMLVGLVLGVQARDIDCAFKLFHAEFLRQHPLETRGAMINAEILYKMKQAGYSSVEVGVHHHERRGGQATGAKPRVIARALKELTTYAWRWRAMARATQPRSALERPR